MHLPVYGPSDFMDTKSRREYLNERFAFICQCQMCMEGNVSGGDDRIEKIRTLQEDIALSSSTTGKDAGAKALSSIKSCLQLMDDSGLGAGVFTKSLLHQGYVYSMAAGDKDGARSYLVDELKAVQDSEGRYCPNAIEIEDTLSQL